MPHQQFSGIGMVIGFFVVHETEAMLYIKY